LLKRRQNNLPGEPEAIAQPSALTFYAAIGKQMIPVIVDIGLRFTADKKRNAFAKNPSENGFCNTGSVAACDLGPRGSISIEIEQMRKVFGAVLQKPLRS